MELFFIKKIKIEEKIQKPTLKIQKSTSPFFKKK